MITKLWMLTLKKLSRLCWVWPWAGCQVLTKLLCPCFSVGQGDKSTTKGLWVEVRARRSFSICHHGQKRLNWEINLLYYQLIFGWWEVKVNLHLPLIPPFFSGLSWLCQTWGKLLEASQRSHPCSSPYQNFATQSHYKNFFHSENVK